MKYANIEANKILTTRDFPVHNEHILKIYFRMCQTNPDSLPPTPVMHKSVGMPLLKEDNPKAQEYNARIKKYFDEHSEVEYIMIDGSHKTTALYLTHNLINAVIIESDDDLPKIKEAIEKGEILGYNNPVSIDETIKAKAEHLINAEFFETVAGKADRMVKEKVIPQYMIDYFNKSL
jgi:hypothetical protein